MARTRVYSQKNHSVLFNGVSMQGLMDGTSISVTEVGGEVELTEGTDGAGVNQATVQGCRISVTFRESSPAIEILDAAVTAQQGSGVGSVFVLRTGVNALYTLTDCFVSLPQEYSTGDKKQAGLTYTFVSPTYTKV